MPSTTEITAAQLSRLIGLPNAPRLIDVRTEEDWAADPRLLPGARRRDFASPHAWQDEYRGKSVIVVCQKGLKLSQGVAAWLRHAGIDAQTLEGGFEAWRAAGQPLVETAKLPPRDSPGPHRLGHPRAAQGRPHRLPLADPPLRRPRRRVPVRRPVRGAARRRALRRHALRHRRRVLEPSRARLHLRHHARGARPQVRRRSCTSPPSCAAPIPRGSTWRRRRPGLLAASLGLSRMYRDDLAQLEAAMGLYDAFYRWCRDASRGDAQLALHQDAGLRANAMTSIPAAATPAALDTAAAALLRRGAARLGQDRRAELRRAGRADRPHAPRAGRREALDRRAALPLGPQLLHAAAGPRGHAARHLRRLAPARREGRPRRRAPVRAARRVRHPGAVDALCGPGQAAGRPGPVRRHPGRRACHRRRGPAAGGAARPQGKRGLADRGGRLRRDLLLQGAVSADRHRRRPLRVLAGHRPGAGRGSARPRRLCCSRRHARWPIWLAIWIVPLLAIAGAVRRRPRARRDRLVLLQAGGGDLRRRLRRPRLHGPGRGAALPAGSPPARCSTASASPRPRQGR